MQRLITRGAAEAARELLTRRKELGKAKAAVGHVLRTREHGLSEDLFRAWRKALRSGTKPPAMEMASSEFFNYRECDNNQSNTEARFLQVLEEELSAARSALLETSRSLLPAYLVFGVGGVRELLTKLLAESGTAPAPLARRSARDGDRERHLFLYLQRICAKNDTFSEFGPSAWGSVDREVIGLKFPLGTRVSKRESFLERWTAHAATAALKLDPEVRAELSPRLHPDGRIEGDVFVCTETGEKIPLDTKTVGLLRNCDGTRPAFSLGVEMEVLEKLARQNIIRWELEVPALDPHAFEALVAAINRWRDGALRSRWLACIGPIAALPMQFARVTETAPRIEMMGEARQRLRNLGAEHETSERVLYSAGNPIAEECVRGGEVLISEQMADHFVRDAEPWIDLWRDTYAFVASRVNDGLRSFFETAPQKNGALPLSAFLRHCSANRMPLTGHGIVALAHGAFQEIKAAFRENVRTRPEADEWELSVVDCHFVRNKFDYAKFDEYTYPSADLQISASSLDAVVRGDYQWILSELHPPVALLHHCFYWDCPDKAALARALASTVCERPNFHFGFAAADFTAHTAVRLFDAMPQLSYFVSGQKSNPAWQTVSPSAAEVFVDGENGDVGLRKRGSHEYLGSFARSWLIPLGFHPFHFGRAPHMPRLRCGSVVVQRRSWTVGVDELASGDFTGISSHLVLAIEQLRSEKGWPRYIFMRPTEQALRRSGAEGRDKDTKPVFVDLESYLSLEIFHRWLKKSGELEVTEMLPDPDHLCWQEADGRRTFELRTLIVPRA